MIEKMETRGSPDEKDKKFFRKAFRRTIRIEAEVLRLPFSDHLFLALIFP